MSLDREIQQLLDVDPSPEFVARVRQRVVAEPAPHAWRTVWTLVPVGAVLAGLMVLVLWREPSSQPDVEVGQTVASDIVLPAPQPAVAVTPTWSARPVARARTEPQVVVSSTEAEGMRLLLDRVATGQLPDMSETLARMDATGPEWIEVVPVVIDPIPQGEGE